MIEADDNAQVRLFSFGAGLSMPVRLCCVKLRVVFRRVSRTHELMTLPGDSSPFRLLVAVTGIPEIRMDVKRTSDVQEEIWVARDVRRVLRGAGILPLNMDKDG